MEQMHSSMEFMDGTPAQHLIDFEPGQRCRFGHGGSGMGKDGECVGRNARGTGWLVRNLDDGRLYDISGQSWIIPLVWDEDEGEHVAMTKTGARMRLPEVGKPRDSKSKALRAGTSAERRASTTSARRAKPTPAAPAAPKDHGEEIAKQVDEELEKEEG